MTVHRSNRNTTVLDYSVFNSVATTDEEVMDEILALHPEGDLGNLDENEDYTTVGNASGY